MQLVRHRVHQHFLCGDHRIGFYFGGTGFAGNLTLLALLTYGALAARSQSSCFFHESHRR